MAVELASNIFGDLVKTRVLLVGAGEIAEKSGRAFFSRGAAHLAIANKRQERASQLASGLGATVVCFEEREARLGEFDIVVCSTAAPGTVISAGAVEAAMRARPDRPLLVVDLAMPRDVEADVVKVDNVFLYNLDDLAGIAEKNRLVRMAEAERGREVLAPRADSLWRQLQVQLANGFGTNAPRCRSLHPPAGAFRTSHSSRPAAREGGAVARSAAGMPDC